MQLAGLDSPICILHFNRHPESIRKAMCEGTTLHSCHVALEDVGYKWRLDSGAKIFVNPSHYAMVLDAVEKIGIGLRPYHVIVSESLKYLTEASLADLSFRQSNGAFVKCRYAVTCAS